MKNTTMAVKSTMMADAESGLAVDGSTNKKTLFGNRVLVYICRYYKFNVADSFTCMNSSFVGQSVVRLSHHRQTARFHQLLVTQRWKNTI